LKWRTTKLWEAKNKARKDVEVPRMTESLAELRKAIDGLEG
jgi:hypothetical protein